MILLQDEWVKARPWAWAITRSGCSRTGGGGGLEGCSLRLLSKAALGLLAGPTRQGTANRSGVGLKGPGHRRPTDLPTSRPPDFATTFRDDLSLSDPSIHPSNQTPIPVAPACAYHLLTCTAVEVEDQQCAVGAWQPTRLIDCMNCTRPDSPPSSSGSFSMSPRLSLSLSLSVCLCLCLSPCSGFPKPR